MRIILLVTILLSGCASNWTRTEQTAFAFNIGCHAVDAGQTMYAMRRGYRETNQVLGDHPSDAQIVGFKAAGLAAIYGVGEWKPESRGLALIAGGALCLVPVVKNYVEFQK